MSINWVMLSRDGEIVKLPGEKIYYKVRSRIGLEIAVPKSLPNPASFSIKSDSGTLYITNCRLIYLAAHPTETFKSFTAPVLDVEDSRVVSSFFGPWSWLALVKPTSSGGVPVAIPLVELKLIFKEGGHDAFQSKFELIKERLSYARTLQQETGQAVPIDEDLPRYEAAVSGDSRPVHSGPTSSSSSGALASATSVGAQSTATTTISATVPPPPSSPLPTTTTTAAAAEDSALPPYEE